MEKNAVERGGILVRMKLAELRLTHTWLSGELKKRGIKGSNSEVSKALAGKLSTPKGIKIVETSFDILADYEKDRAEQIANFN